MPEDQVAKDIKKDKINFPENSPVSVQLEIKLYTNDLHWNKVAS